MAGYALCIGINDYPGTGSDLAGCVNDAKDWAAELKKRKFTVTTLIDKAATKANMLKEMKAVVGNAKKGDVVVITYSGHGSYVPDISGDEADGNDEVLCPADLSSTKYILDDDLDDIFATKAVGVKLVLISDSCHSGTVSRMAPPLGGKQKTRTAKARYLAPESFLSAKKVAALKAGGLRRSASAPGRHSCLLLSGCMDVEVSYDASFGGRANGAFTYAALQALKKMKASSTYKAWHTEIRKLLPTASYPQAPNIYGSATMKKWKIFV